jgi:hypothetical protein
MNDRRARPEGYGFLLPNKFKQAGNRAPDLSGKLTLGETEHTIVAWRKVSTKGERYLNVRLEIAEAAKTRPRRDQRARVGRNAPTPEEAARVALLERTLTALRAKAITLEDVADTMAGEPVTISTLTHLRTNLTAYSFNRRQVANQLLGRFLARAAELLKEVC